jgi:hypothetical protein
MKSNTGREGLGDNSLAFGNQFRGKPVKRALCQYVVTIEWTAPTWRDTVSESREIFQAGS